MREGTLLLCQSDVIRLLKSVDLISTIEDAFIQMGRQKAIMPPKLNMGLGEDGKSWPHHNSFVDAMPSYIEELKLAGMKIVGGYWGNARRGLPTIVANMLLIDPDTGQLLCLMDGTWITAFRTAAVSMLGARHLGCQSPRSVGILGGGTQGVTHAVLASAAFAPSDIRIFDVDCKRCQATVESLSSYLDTKITLAGSVQEVTEASDLVFSVTAASTPFIDAANLKRSGGFLCTIGSYCEATDGVLDWADKIFVDNLEQARHRGALARLFQTQCATVESRISGELPRMLAEGIPGRTSPDQNVWYIPRGMAVGDLAVASLAYREALKTETGTEFCFQERMSPVSEDALAAFLQ